MPKICSRSTRTSSVRGTFLALWTRSSSLSMRTRTSMAQRLSLSGGLFLQGPADSLRTESADVASEGGELLHATGAEETVLRAGHEVERVDLRSLHAVE